MTKMTGRKGTIAATRTKYPGIFAGPEWFSNFVRIINIMVYFKRILLSKLRYCHLTIIINYLYAKDARVQR